MTFPRRSARPSCAAPADPARTLRPAPQAPSPVRRLPRPRHPSLQLDPSYRAHTRLCADMCRKGMFKGRSAPTYRTGDHAAQLHEERAGLMPEAFLASVMGCHQRGPRRTRRCSIPSRGFSRASRRTRALMFRRVAGLPVLPRMDLAAQRRRTMSRCQRRIVSGVTSSRSPCRRAFGITASRVARSARSAQSSRVIRRKTNRRHMTGDHHGQTARGQLRWSQPRTRFSARTILHSPSGGRGRGHQARHPFTPVNPIT
jgi:hypothetical protein